MKTQLTVLRLTFNKRTFFQLGLLLVITLSIYHQIPFMNFQFQWDDQWQVINSMTENGFDLKNIKYIFCETTSLQYAPINQLYYTLLYKIDRYNPMIYHIGSLFFHLLNIFCVYLLSEFMLKSLPTKSPLYSWSAFLVGLLFAIHPIQVESVCWLSASKVVLSTFFYIFAIITYIEYRLCKKKIFFMVSLLSCLLSMGCKEQAVTLFASLLIIDVFLFKRSPFQFNLYLEKVWYILPALVFIAITLVGNSNAPEETIGYTWYERGILSFYSLFRYLILVCFPFKLSYLYPFPFQVGESIPPSLYIYPPIIFFITYLIYHQRKENIVMCCICLFLVNLLPMLHIVPLPRYYVLADRYLYLPYIPFAISLIWYINMYYDRIKKILPATLLIYFCYLGGYSLYYIPKWKNSETLKEHFRSILRQRDDFKSDFPKKSFKQTK